MSDDSKERTRQRFRRQLRHLTSYEEEKERKANRRTRGRWSEADDGDDATFSKMHRRPPGSLSSGHRREAQFVPNRAEWPATVVWLGRGRARVLAEDGEHEALIARDLAAAQRSALAVGDAVTVHERTDAEPLIVAVEPRRSELARASGEHDDRHVLAANIDFVVLVLTAERLRIGLVDRLVLATGGSGAELVLCINKCDVPHDVAARDAALQPWRQRGIPVIATSARTGENVDALHAVLIGRTAAFVGHSGVGKSTLLNRLDPASARPTGEVRERDGRGRHTTTASSLVRLPCGTRLVDTPGVRMFGLVASASDAAVAFPEIVEIAARCRFRDCRHVHEPGCAVRAAVESGALGQERYDAYRRLVADGP
ncbi:MAG: ribosome small subunit-dependent GTPase A [Planctomycetes bacterium]|nr:ribosome small subunit-dependent GTPase A [Planctomycetota bacterium]